MASSTSMVLTAVDRTRAAFSSAQSGLATTQKAVFSLNGAMAGLGVAGVGALIKGTLDSQNALYDMSVRLGVTTEGLSRLQYAAQLSGVPVNGLNTSLQRMTRRLADAALGTGEGVKALQALGLSAEKFKGLKPEDQFSILADALKGVEDPAERVRIAFKLFDSEGVKLLQMMDGGSKGLAEMGAEADRLGVTVSQKTAVGAMQANAALIKLKASGTGLANTMVAQIGPSLAAVAGWMADKLPAAAGLVRDAFRMASAGVLEIVDTMAAGLQQFYGLLGNLPGSVGEIYQRAAGDIQGFRDNISGAQGVIFESIRSGGDSMGEFAVQTGQARYALEQYKGETLAVADASKLLRENASAANLATKESQAGEKDLEGVRQYLLSEERAVIESHTRRRQMVLENTAAGSEAQFAMLAGLATKEQTELTAIHQAEADKRTAIEQEISDAKLAIGKNALEMGAAMAKEGSKGQRVLLAASKGVALAESVMALQVAIAKANALGFPANIPMIAQATTIGVGAINSIKSIGISGMAHDGIDSIPREGTWLLDKGERVVDSRTNGDLKDALKSGGIGDGNVTIINQGAPLEVVSDRISDGERILIVQQAKSAALGEWNKSVAEGNGASARVLEQTYNLKRRLI